MSLYLYLDAVTNLYILKHKGFVFNPKAGSLMLIEREEDGFVNLQALYDNKAFRQNTNGHILNDFIDPETVVNELGVSYGNDAQAIRTALADFFVDAPSGGGGLSVEQVKSQSTTKAPSSKLFADVTGDLELGFKSSIASLENVINSANINQELTATATGVDTVALPKTAANTGMQVQMFGQSATQLVANGNFANGLTGWTTNSQITILDGVVECSTTNAILFIQAISTTNTSKYYVRVLRNSNGGNGTIGLQTAAFAQSSNTILIGTTSGWSYLSGILTATDNGAHLGFVRSGSTGSFFVKSVQLINLTATFGAGNEPTKEQCDVLFANYFEGSDNVLGTGRVRSVGKNLLNLNTVGKKIYTGTLDGMTAAQRLLYYDILMPIARTGVISSSISEYVIAPNRVEVTTSLSSYGIGFKIKAKAGDIFTSKTTTSTGYIGFGSFNSSGVSLSNGIGTFTCPEGTAFILVALVANTANVKAIFTDSLIERGATATTYEPYRQSILQLTTPELRSNGTVKDEIRKGANGYELVKRVGVGTLGSERIPQPINLLANWITLESASITDAATYTSTGAGGIVLIGGYVVGTRYRIKISGTTTATAIVVRSSSTATTYTTIPTGSFALEYTFVADGANLYLRNSSAGVTTITSLTLKGLITTTDGAASSGITTEYASGIYYTLATPTITPIAHAGLLNSNSNGTAYFEPIIADAGVYSSNLAVQLTDYPIASFESIRKYANGTYTELNTATVVIASGGLSFTHPDLVSGDLVMFTYAYNRESIGRSMTLTHYDSRFVEADTSNGKVYRIVPVVTNGVVSWTAVEV